MRVSASPSTIRRGQPQLFRPFWLAGLVAVLLWGIPLLCYSAAVSLDFDEVYSLNLIRAPLAAILTGATYDPGTPPLQFLLLRLWQTVAQDNEFVLRWLPIGASMLAAYSLYRFLRMRLPPVLAGATVLAGWSNTIVWYYSSYLKPYALLLLACMLTIRYSYRLFSGQRRHRLQSALLIAVMTAGFYTHYSYVVFLAVLSLTYTIVFLRVRSPALLVFGKHLLVAVAGFTPWAVYFLMNQFFPADPGKKYFFHQMLEGAIGWGGWLRVFTNGLTDTFPLPVQHTAGLVIALGIGGWFLTAAVRSRDDWTRTILWFSLLSFALLLGTPLHRIFTEARYTLYAIPFTVAGIVILSRRFWESSAGRVTGILLLWLLLCTSQYHARTVWTDWKHLTASVPQRGGGIVLFDPCHTGYVFDYYYSGELPLACLIKNPETIQFPMWDQQPRDRLYILKYSSGWGYEGDTLPMIHAGRQQEQQFGVMSLIEVHPAQ